MPHSKRLIFPRSILYSSARRIENVVNAKHYHADITLIDLEDSVPILEKNSSRQFTAHLFNQGICTPHRSALRINPLNNADGFRDVNMLLDLHHKPDFVFLTMVETDDEIIRLRQCFNDIGWYPQIYATIETIPALEHVFDLAACLEGMILGSADLCATLGVDINPDTLSYARLKMKHASAKHNIACIDTGNFDLQKTDLLKQDLVRVRDMGFHGKGTVHPKEVPLINAAFSICEDSLLQARNIETAYEQAQGGVCLYQGSMIGPPFVRKARQLLQQNAAHRRYFSDEENT